LGGGNAVFTHAENFVIQWVAEWGVPVAGIALVTFAWLLWPRNNKKFDPIITCAYVGLVALLIQNLFDLALEVPAVSIAVSVVCGGLIDSGKRQTEPEARSATIPLRGRFSILFVVLQLAGLIGSLVLGRNTAISDRDLLHQAYDAVRRRETGAEARFQETLRATISRHPGDGYLPLMAAVAAQATNQPALRWLSRSLERDPMNGRTHLALARELGKHGARSQALLELRLAAECEAALVPSTAPLALRWARTLSDLLQAVPEGAPGADMLVTLARQTDATWKDELLREAVRRNPENVDAHLDLGMWLAQQILSNDPACAARRQADCAREVDAHVEALHRLWPGAQWVRLKATLLAALGKPDEALSLLHQACPGTIDQRICFAVALRIASTSGSSPMLSETITHYLGSCAGPQECSSSEIDVGDILAAKEQWGSALPHYTRAAQVLRTAGAWLRVAEVAQRAGAYAQARNAVDRARNDPEHAVPAIQNRLHAIEEQSTARQLRQDPGGAR
jgi:tetratricopeptide (TPR) repeat protein